MSEYGNIIDGILSRPANTWSNEEGKAVGALLASGHRNRLKQVIKELRGGDKIQVAENSKLSA